MTTTPSFAHYAFTPWRAQDSRRIVAPESHWCEPLAWNLAAEKSGERARVLVGCEVFEGPSSMSPESWDLIDNYAAYRTWATIWCTHHLDWMIATECPDNIHGPSRHIWAPGALANATGWVDHLAGEGEAKRFYSSPWPPANLCLGVIVSTQAEADARIPAMLKVPAAVRWVWCRGMMEEINLHAFLCRNGSVDRPEQQWCEAICEPRENGIDWLAISSPTGPDAHPTDLAHVRSVVKQCEGAGVPVWSDEAGLRQLREVGR
jgi:hypothetical protein